VDSCTLMQLQVQAELEGSRSAAEVAMKQLQEELGTTKAEAAQMHQQVCHLKNRIKRALAQCDHFHVRIQ